MKDDNKIELQAILYSYYIKYDKMLKMVEENMQNVNTNKLDIYIDVYDMLRPIYTQNVYTDKQFIIVSSIVNLAAHMRGYFYSRHNVATRIYLVYGEDNTMNHKQFYPSFGNDKFKDNINFDKNNSIVHDQLKMAKILVAYINGVYLVERNTNFAMFVYDNIVKSNPTPAVILSKSKYAYQLPALLPNVFLFRPKKNANDGDVSYCINHSNALVNYFSSATKQDTIKNLCLINPELLSCVIALTGMPQYNLKTICTVSVASKMILEAIDNHRINNCYNSDIDFVYNAIPNLSKYMDNVSFKYRFNAVDLVFQHRIYNSSAEARDITWLLDLYDPNTVKYINNTYFIDNPLDLNNL